MDSMGNSLGTQKPTNNNSNKHQAMTRKKVKFNWIVSDSARRASLKKRRNGLAKKVKELTILCGVSAFVIIYSPDDPVPVVWPPPPAINQVIERYLNTSEAERHKKMTHQDTYLKEKVGKFEDQIRRFFKRNKEMEMSYLMRVLIQGSMPFHQFHIAQIHGLVWFSEHKLDELRKRVEYFQHVPLTAAADGGAAGGCDGDGGDTLPPTSPPGLPTVPGGMDFGGAGDGAVAGAYGMTDNDAHSNDPVNWDQWFLDTINYNSGKDVAPAPGANTSVKGGFGAPRNIFFGGSSAANDPFAGLQQQQAHADFSTVGGMTAGGSVMGLRMMQQQQQPPALPPPPPPQENIMGGADRGFGFEGADMGLGLNYPYQQVGFGGVGEGRESSSSVAGTGSDMSGLRFDQFDDSSSESDDDGDGDGDDVELPFDFEINNWPNDSSARNCIPICQTTPTPSTTSISR